MGIAERKNREKDKLKTIILRAAEELFVRDGFENVSMRKIAKKIEYSPTTIYLYYKDKNQLFRDILERYNEKLLKRMEDISADAHDPLETIRRGMRAYISFGLKNPSYYKLAFMNTPEIKKEEYMAETLKSTALFLNLRDSVDRCIRENIFRPIQTDTAAQAIWTINHGITSLLITNPNFPWVKKAELIETVIDCAMAGLRRI